MPHLSPLYWIIMPTLLLLLIYTHMIYIYFTSPTTFPLMHTSTPKFSSWKWN